MTNSKREGTPVTGGVADLEQAWRTLDLVNGWIRHADTKAGGTLATAGVVGAVLFQLVDSQVARHGWFITAAVACALTVGVTALFATMSLVPRTDRVVTPPNSRASLVYFGEIARDYPAGASAAFVRDFCQLSSERVRMAEQVASQVHANALIAGRKYLWANRALKMLLLALVALAAVASITVLS